VAAAAALRKQGRVLHCIDLGTALRLAGAPSLAEFALEAERAVRGALCAQDLERM
jgi:hypothetical protein